MQYVVGIIGLIFGCCIVKWREAVANEFGDPDWANKVGGMYNVVIIIGIFICFWSLAYMTGTINFLFAPILNMLPIHRPPDTSGGIPLDY